LEAALPLSRDQVQHIARLARVAISEEEADQFSEQLSAILEYFERLQAVNTDDVPPTAHTLPLHNVFRDDEPEPSLTPDEVLVNAPLRENDLLRVRAVLEE